MPQSGCQPTLKSSWLFPTTAVRYSTFTTEEKNSSQCICASLKNEKFWHWSRLRLNETFALRPHCMLPSPWMSPPHTHRCYTPHGCYPHGCCPHECSQTHTCLKKTWVLSPNRCHPHECCPPLNVTCHRCYTRWVFPPGRLPLSPSWVLRPLPRCKAAAKYIDLSDALLYFWFNYSDACCFMQDDFRKKCSQETPPYSRCSLCFPQLPKVGFCPCAVRMKWTLRARTRGWYYTCCVWHWSLSCRRMCHHFHSLQIFAVHSVYQSN